MKSVPIKVATPLCRLDYDLPMVGGLLELTIPEFQQTASMYHDMGNRLAMSLDATIQYPEIVAAVYPAIRALSDIVGDELAKQDQGQADHLRQSLAKIRDFYFGDNNEGPETDT